MGLSFANMDQALFGYAVPAIRAEFGISLQAIGRLSLNLAFTTFVATPLCLSGLVFLGLKPMPSEVEVEEIAI